jgi:exopolysaccharide transport family protein
MDKALDHSEHGMRDSRSDSIRFADFDLKEILRVLNRRKWLIAAVTLLLTLLMVVYVFLATPRYTADLQVLFEPKTGPVVDFKAALSGQPQDEASLLGEIEVIKSRDLAKRVIDKLGLDQNAEFNRALRTEAEWLTSIKQYVKSIGGISGVKPEAEQSLTEEQRRSVERERMINTFLDKLEATQTGRSRAVDVEFTSENPVLSAEIANTLADLYLVSRLEGKFENAKRASTWLAERVETLRQQVEQSETAVENYRKQHGLLQGERVTLVAERISDLSAKLTDASIARTQAEANLSQARRLTSRSGDVSSAVQVLQSELIERFREKELELARKEAEMLERYGPRHPLIIQLNAEKAKFRETVQAEVTKIIRSLENEVQVARRREEALARDLDGLKAQVEQANTATVGMRTLQRDSEANRLLLEKFMTAFMETSAQEDVESQLPDARIISRAAIPEKPSFPRKTLMIVIGFVGAALISVLLAFTIEQLDPGFRSAEQIEHAIGLPVLAIVPRVENSRLKGDTPDAYAFRRPDSAFGEAIRSVYTRLLLSAGSQPPKTLLFVSSEASEGKTTIALSVARLQAKAEKKVLLLDADFRRSMVAERLNIADAPGLADLLGGSATLADIVRKDPLSGADIIVSGRPVPDGGDLLSSGKLEKLLAELKPAYDLIILDCAPVLALSDANILSGMADMTLLVVRWGQTRREVVKYALRQVNRLSGNVVGVVLSIVDVRQHAYYGYGDSGYYYGKSAKYYSS